jgi:hypothetical protein
VNKKYTLQTAFTSLHRVYLATSDCENILDIHGALAIYKKEAKYDKKAIPV